MGGEIRRNLVLIHIILTLSAYSFLLLWLIWPSLLYGFLFLHFLACFVLFHVKITSAARRGAIRLITPRKFVKSAVPFLRWLSPGGGPQLLWRVIERIVIPALWPPWARGEPPLPDEDMNKIFKPLPVPSRLDNLILSQQVNNYCQHVNQFSTQSFGKLFLAQSLQEEQKL